MTVSRRNLLVGAAVLGGGGLLLSRGGAGKSGVASPPLVVASGRDVRTIVSAAPTIEGAGVHLSRAIGGRALPLLDPFLLLDTWKSDDPDDYAAGFPSHPHRGFETVTYMIDGTMEHRDSKGNQGRLGPLCAQWMTAGHGIVHSECRSRSAGSCGASSSGST